MAKESLWEKRLALVQDCQSELLCLCARTATTTQIAFLRTLQEKLRQLNKEPLV